MRKKRLTEADKCNILLNLLIQSVGYDKAFSMYNEASSNYMKLEYRLMPWISKRRIAPKTDNISTNKKHSDSWGHYYQNRQWKKLRDWYMLNHPLCEDCLFEGRSVPSEECHHVRPFSTGETEEERMKLLLDENNLVALCHMHHKKRHGYLNR